MVEKFRGAGTPLTCGYITSRKKKPERQIKKMYNTFHFNNFWLQWRTRVITRNSQRGIRE